MTVPAAGIRRRISVRQLPAGVRIALLLTPALAVVLLLFLAGLGLGALQSLGYQPYLHGWSWTLSNYTGLARDPAVTGSILLTARIAFLATAASAGLGLGIVMLIHSTGRGRRLLTGTLQAILSVPHLVGALAISLLLSDSGLISRLTHAAGWTSAPADFPALTQDSFGWSILAEYIWKTTPFVAVVTLAALVRGITGLEDVAATLGASGWQRFRHVILPLVTPALAAASVIVFAFTCGSYEVPLILGRPYPAPLPVVAYQRFTDTDLTSRPQAYAIGVVIAVTVTVLVAIYLKLLDRVVAR